MLKLLASLIIFLGTFYLAQEVLKPAPPCTTPILYSLGTFDKRFNLSEKEFLNLLRDAESIWEKPIGKDLFAYSPEGKLKENLIYDYRQEATKELSKIEAGVKQDEASYRALESGYQSLKVQHDKLEASYNLRLESFNRQSMEYESNVEEWNRSDRTDKNKFRALEAQRLSLESELREIKKLEAGLNQSADNVNSLVARLNSLGRELNLNVEEYNIIGTDRGDTFTGGLYTSDEIGESIDIFEFENEDKLVRILTHELGHALGLEHVSDKDAIMYELNLGSSKLLTEVDLQILKTLCQTN